MAKNLSMIEPLAQKINNSPSGTQSARSALLEVFPVKDDPPGKESHPDVEEESDDSNPKKDYSPMNHSGVPPTETYESG
jgi:hypothetical protein